MCHNTLILLFLFPLEKEDSFNYILLAIMAPFIVALVVVAMLYTYKYAFVMFFFLKCLNRIQ